MNSRVRPWAGWSICLGLTFITAFLSAGCSASRPTADDGESTYDVAHTRSGPGAPDPDAPTRFITTDTGLRYRVLRKGDGRKPTPEDTVTVHYRGWLDDGSEFDSSYPDNKPATFPLKGVVPGWTEGLQHVREGGMIELEIPSSLGYGALGDPSGKIPGGATLHFIVELIAIR